MSDRRRQIAKAKRRQEAQAYVRQDKKRGCTKCGKRYKNHLLHYHHLDPSKKFMKISSMIREGYTLRRIKAEMKKCVLLCRWCHEKEHAR